MYIQLPFTMVMRCLVVLLFLCNFVYTYIYDYESEDFYDSEEFTDHSQTQKCRSRHDIKFSNSELNYFECFNGECILSYLQCNGVADCEDGSDETPNTCHFTSKPNNYTCSHYEYKCKKDTCIPAAMFCDVIKDCPDGSDEYDDCVKHLDCSNKFRCNDGHCVFREWVCDGRNDCFDGSDELICSTNKTISAENCKIENSQYLCGNKQCVHLDAVCNGKDDCGDGSDEGAGCTPSSCPSSVKCDHECKQTPKGSVCFCKPGYKLQNDNRTCIDIDECQTYGICDQECVNSPGSYSCKCQTDYLLQEDKKTCKASGNAKLLISTKNDIIGIYINTEINDIKLFNELIYIHYPTSFAMNNEYIYFLDLENGKEVIRRKFNNHMYEDIVTVGLSKVSAMAIDWITGNLYFTDEGNHHIGVCKSYGTIGTNCTQLINDIDKPIGIALLPTRGKMYWSNWGTNPHIAVAGMDGKNIHVFVSENIKAPRSLTVDYQTDRLYWVDFKLNKIESIRLDGTDRRLVLHNIIHDPLSLAIFENKLYWTSTKSNTIQSCNKFTGKDRTILYRSLHYPYNVHIEHPALKPKINNPCLSNPCSELCMLNQENGYTCACILDKKLNADNHTCQEMAKKQHLLISNGKLFLNYYDGMIGNPKVKEITKLLMPTTLVQDIASDPVTGQVLLLCIGWSDVVVRRYDPVSNILENIISMNKSFPRSYEGIAFDYISNNLYITNKHNKSIEIYNVKTLAMTVFYFSDNIPQYISLVPEESKMYVAFKKSSFSLLPNISVYEMATNGLGERKLLMSDLKGSRISMCYHRDSKTLFVSDEGSGNIFLHSAEGTRKFRTYLNHPISLTIAGDNIYWTEYFSNKLYSTNVKNTSDLSHKDVVFYRYPEINLSFVVTLGKDAKQDHDCQKNNGNCSHVCLPSSNTSFICACPPGMRLLHYGTCFESNCQKTEFKCSEHICLSKTKVCNGIIDCPNGEDETMDCHEKKKCEKDHFTCANGECIDINGRCNLIYDCNDQSDEKNCKRPKCGTGLKNRIYKLNRDYIGRNDEFQCHSIHPGCISKKYVCDGTPHCLDESDETNDACESIGKCLHGHFRCSNGDCISSSLKCDGFDDCLDGSDELFCLYTNFLVNCSKNQYHCLDTNLCFPLQIKCDGEPDCPKSDDENNCVFCSDDEFTCDRTKCIPKNWVCDKMDDCDDKSDEEDCVDGKKIITDGKKISTECDEFKCSIGTCLPYARVCNGFQDCPDGSDENGKCHTACSIDSHCESLCHKTPKGDICECLDGYRLAANATSCEDINECENDVCSQFCQNTVGSFKCSCNEGYHLRGDRVSCRAIGPTMDFVTVTENDIRIISSHFRWIDTVYSLSGFSINGLDVNAVNDSIYWSNSEFGIIKKLKIKTKEISTITVEHPQALAIDWITDNVYVNNNGHLNTIQVCTFEKQRCVTLVKIEDKAKVGSLLVDSTNRWLFWSEITWQMDKPFSKIYRTDMMGADMKIIHSDIGFVSGMVVEHIKSKLYWLDSFNKTIQLSNLDGSQRSTFLSTNMFRPLSISIYEQSLYWLTGVHGQLRRCKLYGNKLCETLDIGPNNVHRQFTLLHRSRQPFVNNPCDELFCDYMCALKKENATCICSDGKPIESNTTCTINSEQLIGNTQHTSIYITTIIVLLIVVLLLCVYCYQRNRSQWKLADDLNIHRIRFQNPSYDRRDEVELTLDSTIEDLSSEQHEHVNPIDDEFLSMKAAMESKRRDNKDQVLEGKRC